MRKTDFYLFFFLYHPTPRSAIALNASSATARSRGSRRACLSGWNCARASLTALLRCSGPPPWGGFAPSAARTAEAAANAAAPLPPPPRP